MKRQIRLEPVSTFNFRTILNIIFQCMLFITVLMFDVVPVSAQSQHTQKGSKWNRYIKSLIRFNHTGINETVYIHTDREVYAPQDTVWFKGYIRNKAMLTPSNYSKTFFILLVNSSGHEVLKEKYLIMDSEVKGQFYLESRLEEGIYYFLGYSSWMENYDIGEICCKKIMVQKEKRVGLQIVIAYDKQQYFPGDTIQLLVHCYDDLNREIEDVSFSYRFVSGKKVLQKGKGNTAISNHEYIPLMIPPELDTPPEFIISSGYKMERLDTSYSLPVSYFVDVGFFPEGGHCINGLEGNMAFKATTIHGKPVDIEGNIIDQQGKILTTIKSHHNGMGVFPFRPDKNCRCYLQVTQPSGINKSFPLPAGTDKGWLLQVKNHDDTILAEIRNMNIPADTALLTLMVRGYLCYYKTFQSDGNVSIVIPTVEFPDGVGVLTLFDKNMLPRAERLIFINRSEGLDADLHTDRQTYIPRDSVTLKIKLSDVIPDLVKGSYSLSVIDDFLCSTDLLDEPDIRTSLLLSPEIKGKIFQPNGYFSSSDEETHEYLDLLLMTQGWRDYKYPEIIEKPDKRSHPKNMDIISGHLEKQPFGRNSRATGGTVTALFGGKSTKIPVEKDGLFSFLPDYSPEFNSGLLLSAVDMKGNDRLSIILDSSSFEKKMTGYLKYLTDSMGREQITPILTYSRLQDYFSQAFENHQWIEEVVIIKTIRKDEFNYFDHASSKRRIPREDINMARDVEDLINMNPLPSDCRKSMFFIIDDVLQSYWATPEAGGISYKVPDYAYAMHLHPQNIQELNIIWGMEVQGWFGLEVSCIIDIKTKPVSERIDFNIPINPVNIKRFAVTREFYKPVYDTEEKRKDMLPDLRKTIHWEPDVWFTEDGIAAIKFYNGDRYTRIRCILEGITEEGIPVHAEHTYNVSLTRE